jgi:pyruvate formate lyase activating enzyme
MKGYFHSIETFGTVDGPGIRYVLFLSGCPMHCSFCHNPDTWEQGNQTITVETVLADVEKYRNFYERSGGGITVSGGEPLMQAEFVTELFKHCHARKIHTLLDTSGCAPLENLKMVLPYTDTIQFSIKAVEPVKHQTLTVRSNDAILANLHYAAESQLPLIIRYVIIPDVNNATSDMNQLADLVKSLPGSASVELLAYHTLGLEKWEKLGKKYTLTSIREANAEDLNIAKAILNEQGIQVIGVE